MKYDPYTDRFAVVSNMIEVDLGDDPKAGFHKVKETLQRMGLPSERNKELYQTAHILHKQGQYYICHFKELFALDGQSVELSEGDIARRNLIVKYLSDWGLLTPISAHWRVPMGSPKTLKVLKHNERDKWNLVQKYTIGAV